VPERPFIGRLHHHRCLFTNPAVYRLQPLTIHLHIYTHRSIKCVGVRECADVCARVWRRCVYRCRCNRVCKCVCEYISVIERV